MRTLRLFLIFLLLFPGLEANDRPPNPITELAAEATPNTLINGCVDPISGGLVQRDSYVRASGSDPISFTRVYSSNLWDESYWGFGSGCDFPLRMDYIPGTDGNKIYAKFHLREFSKIDLYAFRSLENGAYVYRVHPRTYYLGATHQPVAGVPGAHHHLLTMRVERRGDEWTQTLGCGTRRHYKGMDGARLQREELPSGNKRDYEYDHSGRLAKISTTNADESYRWNEIKIDHRRQSYKVSADNGQEANYILRAVSQRFARGRSKRVTYLAEVKGEHFPTHSYELVGHPQGELQVNKVALQRLNGSPLKRKIGYDQFGRVSYIDIPNSRNNGLQLAYGISYSQGHKQDYIAVKTPFNAQVSLCDRYEIDSHRRVSRILRGYSANGQALCQETFAWNSHDAKEERGHLLYRMSCDEKGHPLSATAFTYDERGNVVEERLYGEICSQAAAPIAFNRATRAAEGTDCYRKTYRYSDDGFNLILKEEDPHGTVIRHSYKPGTNLRVSTLLEFEGKVLKRQFFSYDDCANLIENIEDDGSGETQDDLANVYQRLITRHVIEKDNPAAFGSPKETRAYFYDRLTGEEVLLERWDLHYDERGLCILKERYDANNAFAYCLSFSYDERRRLIAESDPLGEVTVHSYDKHFNRASSHQLGTGCTTRYHHNVRNECTKIEQICDDGSGYAEEQYFHLGGPLEEGIDRHGSNTRYIYDAIGRLVEQRDSRASEKITYNALGHVSSRLDRRGYRTEIRSNIFGDPIHIAYPDGTSESYEYSPARLLLKKRERNGTEISYQYDALKHVIREEAKGKHYHSVKSYHYQGNLLVDENDNGRLTSHSYDGAGRLTFTEQEGRERRFHYDSLGRLNCEEQVEDDRNCIRKITVYDLADRVLQEKEETQSGKLLSRVDYHYDRQGREIERSEWLSETDCAITKKFYNDAGELIATCNPIGEMSTWEYQHGTGDQALCVISADPLGMSKWSYQNAYDELLREETRNTSGERISLQEFTYDPNGNCVSQEETIYSQDGPQRSYSVHNHYDAMDQLTEEIEQEGSSEERRVSFVYDKKGQCIQRLKADRTIIHYEYNGAGSVIRQRASDGSVDLGFGYNAQQELTHAKDFVTGLKLRRAYNCHGQLSQERLGSLYTGFIHDRLGRRKAMHYPDGTEAHFHYKDGHLHEISRNGQCYGYEDYSLTGKASTHRVPHALHLHIERDLLERTVAVESAQWKLTVPPDGYDAVGNLLQRSVTDSLGCVTQKFSYDPWYQLASETGPFTRTYSNDSLSNLLKKDDEDFAHDGLNQLVSAGETRCRYDLNGNLIEERTSQGSRHYTYDALDRLLSLENETLRVCFAYDPLHRRSQKTVYRKHNGDWLFEKQQNYFYDGDLEIGSCDAAGEIQELRVLGKGLAADMGAAVFIELNGKTYIPIHDPVGHVACLLSANTGQVVENYRLSAYGEKLCDTSVPVGNPWVFSCKREDPETGLIYFGRRYYSPGLCRWITADPSRFFDGLNLYAYVHGNPLAYFDPYGLDSWWQNTKEYFHGFMAGIGTGIDNNQDANPFAGSCGPWAEGGIGAPRAAEEGYWDRYRIDFSQLEPLMKEYGPIEGCFRLAFDFDKVSQTPYQSGQDLGRSLVDFAAVMVSSQNVSSSRFSSVSRISQQIPMYDARTLKRMSEDAFHNFPTLFEGSILSQKPVVRSSGRFEYMQRGSINRKEGVFHITTDHSGSIMRHRTFIPKDDWPRYSRRWELPGYDEVM